jgi:hypothetical protein
MGMQRIHHEGVWSRLTSIQQREQVIRFYKKMNAYLESAYHQKKTRSACIRILRLSLRV